MPVNEASAPAQTKPELPTFGRERLSPGAYYLDFSQVATFPLKDSEQPSTFGDIYYKLRKAKILKMPDGVRGDETYVTDSGAAHATWGVCTCAHHIHIYPSKRVRDRRQRAPKLHPLHLVLSATVLHNAPFRVQFRMELGE